MATDLEKAAKRAGARDVSEFVYRFGQVMRQVQEPTDEFFGPDAYRSTYGGALLRDPGLVAAVLYVPRDRGGPFTREELAAPGSGKVADYLRRRWADLSEEDAGDSLEAVLEALQHEWSFPRDPAKDRASWTWPTEWGGKVYATAVHTPSSARNGAILRTQLQPIYLAARGKYTPPPPESAAVGDDKASAPASSFGATVSRAIGQGAGRALLIGGGVVAAVGLGGYLLSRRTKAPGPDGGS